MIRYIAFLRGINVSGQKLIKMETLRQYFAMPGLSNIVTYIQSGNVLFDAKETEETKLLKKIGKGLARQLGYEVPVVLRSVEEIKTIIANNPFKKIPADNRKLYVHFLSSVPDDSLFKSLEGYKNESEDIRIFNREVYLLTGSYGNTRLNNSLIEKKLGVTSTARNWATVNKIINL